MTGRERDPDGREHPVTPPPVPADEAGDPACWLDRVCPECGRFAEGARTARCPSCGAELDPR